jgi:hypothetical protein
MRFLFDVEGTARCGEIRLLLKRVTNPINGPLQNLVAVSEDGSILWTAENPINLENSFYCGFICMNPLQVYNYAGFLCTIDPTTGKVLDTMFTK